MTAPELHADDLLDREVRGSLTSDERARLEEHLAVCSVCRFERVVRADFRTEFSALGPARAPAAPEAEERRARPAGARKVGRVRWLGMVAVLLFTGAAAAELSGGRLLSYLGRSWKPAPTPAPLSRGVETSQQAPARPGRRSTQPEGASEAASATASAAPEMPPSLAPEATSSGRALGEPRPSSVRQPLVARTPSDLFDDARGARERGDYAAAQELYERLLALYPSSPQALTTHAVLGRLLLDRGEPAAAMRHFDAYLASGSGSLGAEAELGRALAYGRLGQRSQEAEAWRGLLQRYPSSVYATRAKERLAALTAE